MKEHDSLSLANHPSLYKPFFPYMPSTSFAWQRAGHHSLHLSDVLSSGPGAGDFKTRWWNKVLTVVSLKKIHSISSQDLVSRTLLIIYCGCVCKCCKLSSWHFESFRWKSLEIHYLENAIGMNHRRADQTWLCILVMQCSIAQVYIDSLSSRSGNIKQ